MTKYIAKVSAEYEIEAENSDEAYYAALELIQDTHADLEIDVREK